MMSTALDRGSARADVLQSLSGLLLVLFVWAHMCFESSILLGKDAMYWVTKMFEGEHLFGRSYPALVSGVAIAVFVLLAVHALLAMRKVPASYRQYRTFRAHMQAMQHADTSLWFVQVVTGFALFFLASAHVFMVILQPADIGPYASSDRIWSDNFWILYALLLLTVHLHAGVGMYRLALKWLPLPANVIRARRRLKLAMWGVIGLFLCLGTASLAAYMVIGYEHAPRYGERYVPSAAAGEGN